MNTVMSMISVAEHPVWRRKTIDLRERWLNDDKPATRGATDEWQQWPSACRRSAPPDPRRGLVLGHPRQDRWREVGADECPVFWLSWWLSWRRSGLSCATTCSVGFVCSRSGSPRRWRVESRGRAAGSLHLPTMSMVSIAPHAAEAACWSTRGFSGCVPHCATWRRWRRNGGRQLCMSTADVPAAPCRASHSRPQATGITA